ncbi:IS1 family transposase [bacterium]|nr:IS1 family transposase [bacterium]
MSECPYCQDTDHQVKAGKTGVGSQRWKCKPCKRRYTPAPKQMYSDEMRQQAVKMDADGAGFRQVARHFGVDHVTIMNWVKAHVDQLPAAPVPDDNPLHVVEMDELYTYVGNKKTGATS